MYLSYKRKSLKLYKKSILTIDLLKGENKEQHNENIKRLGSNDL
jgi:hypothetical protein